MSKKLLLLLIALPLFVCCNDKPAPDDPDDPEVVNPSDDDIYAKAAPEVKNGDRVLATNRNVEKFLTEVTYPDKDWSETKIYDYYGGFNRKKYDENGNLDPNGDYVKNPKSDKPESYSIRWKDNLELGALNLHLADKLGWSQDISINPGSAFIDITNLVPDDHYTYKVTASDGTVMTEGAFDTYGHLHQVFFRSACRNGRDLGGWKTLDGKTVKYRKLYRGGRMEEINSKGGVDAIAQGIGAELDLRNSDALSKSPVSGLDFCAPLIETGGKTMLTTYQDKTKQCFEFVVNSLRAGKGVYFHCSLGRDRTGTLAILLLGLLGVREGDISKEYEVTYFAPLGYSCSSSETESSYDKEQGWLFQNNRTKWVYSDVAPYFWSFAGASGTFASGVEKYLLSIGISQNDIDDFRNIMLN
ncbi:MAG: tyrosine-protein phosphatase [Bacteroidales bacterium]|nr:tyrosine-protein phosphatase [Bacteroidales bacterium]